MMIYVLLKNHNIPADDPKKNIDFPLYTLILFGLQIIIGLGLYFISNNVSFESGFMKNSQLRFFTMEHVLGMSIAFLVMLRGYIKMRKTAVFSWNKVIRLYYGIALLIILLSIPWPFRGFGHDWF
jgi:hypothetical protein